MATAPILDVTDSRSAGREAATAQFRRLQRVRDRQRSRRRYCVMLVAPLAVLLAGAGVLVFAAVLGASLEPLLEARTAVRAGATTRPSFSTIGPGSAVTAASAPIADAVLPLPPVGDTARPAATRPSPRRSTPRAAAPDTGSVPARAGAQDDEAAPTGHGEARDAEGTDPAMAIDWLLNQSRTRGR